MVPLHVSPHASRRSSEGMPQSRDLGSLLILRSNETFGPFGERRKGVKKERKRCNIPLFGSSENMILTRARFERQTRQLPSASSTQVWLITGSSAYGHPWPTIVEMPDATVVTRALRARRRVIRCPQPHGFDDDCQFGRLRSS